jgi:predicted RNA-binding protein
MTETLFQTEELEDYVLEITYKGSSFDGQMELLSLEKELKGLDTSLQSIINTLSRHKRISFKSNDVLVYVEAFEKGSFRKRIKIVMKTVEKYPANVALVGVIFAGTFGLISELKSDEIKKMSPELMAKIGDGVKIELLKDSEFLIAARDVVSPLNKEDDQLVIKQADAKEVIINEEDKEGFYKLSGQEDNMSFESENNEELVGKVTRVDLDATKNHIGFKVDNKGTTILCTLVDKISQEDMKNLLGQWLRISGKVTTIDGVKTHIYISIYQIIEPVKQTDIPFDEDVEGI